MLTKLIIFSLIFILIAGGLYIFLPYRAINKTKSDNYYFNFLKTKVHFIPMGNSFELGNDKMEDVDLKSVEVLGRNYLKDKNAVYFKFLKIKDADPGSFKMLDDTKSFFAKDKSRLYYKSHPFKDLDLNNIEFARGIYGIGQLKDKLHVYTIYPIEDSRDADAAVIPIDNVNAADFQFLDDRYGKDNKHAYYKGRLIDHSDAKTFTLLGDYTKDSGHVYYDGLVINNIDAATFKLIEGGSYVKDKNAVYFGLNTVDDKNEKPVKYEGKIVTAADPNSFEMITGEKIDYAKDKLNFYWGGQIQNP